LLKSARLIALNTPLNPAGTVLSPGEVVRICEAIVEENRRRDRSGGKPLYLLYDQVYWMLTFGSARHEIPVRAVPEVARYTVFVDGISKSFAATGVRVGWCIGPHAVIGAIRDILGHVGAWAPRAEQVATAEYRCAKSTKRCPAWKQPCGRPSPDRLRAVPAAVTRRLHRTPGQLRAGTPAIAPGPPTAAAGASRPGGAVLLLRRVRAAGAARTAGGAARRVLAGARRGGGTGCAAAHVGARVRSACAGQCIAPAALGLGAGLGTGAATARVVLACSDARDHRGRGSEGDPSANRHRCV